MKVAEDDNNIEDNNEDIEQQAKNHNKVIIAIVLVVIILAIGLTLGLYFGLRNNNKNDDITPNPDPEIVEPGPSLCDHIWDDGVVILEPTCTETGIIEYTCIICGETLDEEIPSLGHECPNPGYLLSDYGDTTGLVGFICSRCHMTISEIRDLYFSSDTWEEISKYASSGEASSRYYIGETKDISIKEIYSSTSYTEDITLRIVDFDHDDLSEEDSHYDDIEYNNGSNKAAITLESVTLLRNTYSFNTSRDNTDGWSGSDIRTNLNDKSNTNSLYNTLIPSELSPLLRTIDKSSNTGQSDKDIITSSDTLFLFSLAELYSQETILNTTSYEQVSDYGEIYSKEGSQYRYYSYFLGDSDPSNNNEVLSKTSITGSWDTDRSRWLTRTATLDDYQYVFYIDSAGSLYYTFTNLARNVSVGFCL